MHPYGSSFARTFGFENFPSLPSTEHIPRKTRLLDPIDMSRWV